MELNDPRVMVAMLCHEFQLLVGRPPTDGEKKAIQGKVERESPGWTGQAETVFRLRGISEMGLHKKETPAFIEWQWAMKRLDELVYMVLLMLVKSESCRGYAAGVVFRDFLGWRQGEEAVTPVIREMAKFRPESPLSAEERVQALRDCGYPRWYAKERVRCKDQGSLPRRESE